jgi:outer membrane protein assembly factor BamE (lipoprotein component of BamABCDE complex)
VQGYALWDQADPFNDRPFDAETWRMYAGSDVPDNPRGKMAEAVISDVLPGMNRDQVQSELGRPDAISIDDPCLPYYLGMWSGNRTHPDWLMVYFDEEGRFSHAEIVQH